MSNKRPADWPEFQDALSITLSWEGGYVNHPLDPGGPTNMGITLKTLRQACKDGIIPPPVGKERLKDLRVEDVEPVYYEYYWKASGADRVPTGLDAALFDAAVNHGPARAVRFLQKAVVEQGRDISVDGIFGPETMNATRMFIIERGVDVALQGFHLQRFLAWAGLKAVFRKGWFRRGLSVYQRTLRLALDSR